MPTTLAHPAKAAQALAYYRQRAELARSLGRDEAADGLDGAVAHYERLLAGAERCRHCGRALEDPVSIARGIGSRCWSKGAR